MPEAQQHDDGTAAEGGTPPGSGGADETTRMPAPQPPVEPGDEATTVLPAGTGAPAAGVTVPTEPVDDDRTTVLGASDVPAIDRTSVLPPAADVWTGRANVREPQPVAEDTGPVIEYAPRERTALGPILIGVVSVLLLGVLAVAVWLVLRDGTPAPLPSESPTAAPASVAPSSAAPSPPVSASAGAVQVAVPLGLVGMTEQQAIAALEQVGLNPDVDLRQTDEAAPGTVVAVEPVSGSMLEPGSTVRIVVAVPPSSPSPSPEASPETSPSPSPEVSPGG